MEGMNPFWFTAYLVSLVLGGAFLLLTFVALAVWLFLRSRGSLVFFFVSLGCLACVGSFVVLSLVLIGSRWP
jgi:hypothetical protein